MCSDFSLISSVGRYSGSLGVEALSWVFFRDSCFFVLTPFLGSVGAVMSLSSDARATSFRRNISRVRDPLVWSFFAPSGLAASWSRSIVCSVRFSYLSLRISFGLRVFLLGGSALGGSSVVLPPLVFWVLGEF